MISIHYSRGLAIAAAVVGVLLLLVGLLTGNILNILVGLLLGAFGVLVIRNPVAVVTDTEVQMRNPLGMTVRRFPISGPADLRVEGNKVVHVPTGKRALSLGFGTRAADAEKVRTWIGGEGPGASQP